MHTGKSEITNKIDPDNYFESLLDYLITLHLIDDSKRQQIMEECLGVFHNRMYRFSGGDSSVSKERGQSLMNSIVFTLSYALKKVLLSVAIKVVTTQTINDIYQIGLSLIKEDMQVLQKEIANLQSRLFVTKLQVYNDTVLGGFSGFFKVYNFDYTADEIGITADYQTVVQPSGKGIEFMLRYVKNIEIENTFCRHFLANKVDQLLIRHHPKYQYLIINISEIILLEMLGLSLLQKDIYQLVISDSQRIQLEKLLKNQNKEELLDTLQSAYNQAMIEINLLDKEVYQYFYQVLPNSRDIIYHQLQLDKLENIFL